MAIAQQSKTQSTVEVFNSLTTSVTVSSGSDLLLLVVVNLESNSGGTITVSGVTFGGVALTRAEDGNHATWALTEIWYLKNPSVSTANVVVSLSGTSTVKAGHYVFTGVDQSTTFRTPQVNSGSSGTSSSVTVPSVVSGDYLIDGLTIDGAGHSVTAGTHANQTIEWDTNMLGATDGVSSSQAGADGGVMAHTWTTSAPFSHVAVGMIPSGGNIDVTGVSAVATGSGPQPGVSVIARPYASATVA